MPKHFGVYFANYPRPMRLFFIAFFALLFFFAGLVSAAQSLQLTIAEDTVEGVLYAIAGAGTAIIINFIIMRWVTSKSDARQTAHLPLNMDLFGSDDDIESPSDLGFNQ